MTFNAVTLRQQQLQLVRLRCQLERKQLQLQAIAIRTDYALVNELGGTALKFKRVPLLIAAAGVGILLFRPQRSGNFLRTGLKLWGLWQRFSPLVAPLIELIRGRTKASDADVDRKST